MAVPIGAAVGSLGAGQVTLTFQLDGAIERCRGSLAVRRLTARARRGRGLAAPAGARRTARLRGFRARVVWSGCGGGGLWCLRRWRVVWSGGRTAWLRRFRAWLSRLRAWLGRLRAWLGRLRAWLGGLRAWLRRLRAWLRRVRAWLRRLRAGRSRLRAWLRRLWSRWWRLRGWLRCVLASLRRLPASPARLPGRTVRGGRRTVIRRGWRDGPRGARGRRRGAGRCCLLGRSSPGRSLWRTLLRCGTLRRRPCRGDRGRGADRSSHARPLLKWSRQRGWGEVQEPDRCQSKRSCTQEQEPDKRNAPACSRVTPLRSAGRDRSR